MWGTKRFNPATGRYEEDESPGSYDFVLTCPHCEAELDAAFGRLTEGGSVLMPPANYGFSAKFAWVNDRFGVSWQLNLR